MITSKLNPQTRIDIMLVIAEHTQPIPTEAIAYFTGMRTRTVQEYLQKMTADNSVQRARLGRGWAYFVSEAAKKEVMREAGFAGKAVSA